MNTSFYYSVWLDNDRLTIAFRKGEWHGTSPAGRIVRHHLLCDMRRYRLVRHESIHAVRPGHLACHAASVHRLLGNRGRMRSRFIQFGLRTKITFADTQAWLGHSGSPCFRDPCAFRGVRVDHFRHIVHDVVHHQQHDGHPHAERLSANPMRGHRRRCRLYHFRAGGTYECQNDRFPTAVFRGVRRKHRRIDVRRSVLVQQ